ncbi:putative oxidoreductase [Golovinomyces cichoracearum]|uniref:Putative oxidoreductase n=1 Tax=Golovinomyces cichoracearum TaxID=62708 RepID=A0A420J4E0_9PEZI|nr:putative oxidoreductase [Golovinomyces cichoracearum]
MAWALVCPASRGIGFHLTRHLLQHSNLPVVATARKDATLVKKSLLSGLENVDENRLKVVTLDVTDESSISRAADEVKSLYPSSTTNPLYLSFCMPGILHPEKSPSQIQHADIVETFAVNTIGPLMMIKHFSPFLPRKKNLNLPSIPNSTITATKPELSSIITSKSALPPHAIWLNMSARVGSITDNSLGGWYSYRASKAAVNSITKSLDLFLLSHSGKNAMAISYHPGTVKTDLSKDFWGSVSQEKLFTPEFAVSKMWDVVRGLDLSGRGKCFDWRGDVILP